MKITCQSCQSKYTIADDKVLGKVVKIKCKKCAATIFVNGSDGSTTVGSDTDNEPLSRYRAENVPEGWTVNVADGEQKTMTDQQVVIAFQAGTISAETFLWKDGMPDWVPLREVGELFRSCTASAATAAPSTSGKRAPSPQAFGGPAASLAQSSSRCRRSYGQQRLLGRLSAGGRCPASRWTRSGGRPLRRRRAGRWRSRRGNERACEDSPGPRSASEGHRRA
jgi:predicted Zn finger-like uncharacterized protein